MDTQAKKARKGKALAEKTTQTIDLDKDKPFDWDAWEEKYNGNPPDHKPPNDRIFYENGDMVCLTIPYIFVKELPQEWDICLKYKDEDIRIIGKADNVLCNNVQQINEPVLKLALNALAHSKDGDTVCQPYNEAKEAE